MNQLKIVQKISQIPKKAGMGHQIGSDFQFARQACIRALDHLNGSRQLCIVAGQMLRELRDRCRHGEFMPLCEENIPEITHRTVTTWIRGAESVTKFLKFPDAIEVDSVVTPLSEILTADDKNLSKEGRTFKQTWFNWTNGKSIKEITLGDEVAALSRSLGGKYGKNAGGGGDRKDFPKFIGKKLSQLTTHLEHYKNFTGPQLERTESLFKQNIAKWPTGALEMAMRHFKEELKTR